VINSRCLLLQAGLARSAIHIRWTTTLPELAATQGVTERWITLV